ncbi:branched-chain amino acid transport system II carrier protein [Oceanobacillus massiliensis]|uniref:branched-chain amino acid transport system II carrier protein n=1 Tax=Oceanobacillus massiliensis TaxID=1465765 RepID=UPI003AFA8979
MKKDIFTIGLMLFALFFGAGNLIYPPTLGIESGTAFWPAITGFIITGVGLPLLAVTAISFVKNDARELADRVHPIFGLIFTSIVYLAIAPFFGIPRASTVAYEMSVNVMVDGNSSAALFLFTSLFFILVYVFSLSPSQMVDKIGRYLTPILLLAIIALGIGSVFLLHAPLSAPAEKYSVTPFFTGFMEGYLTMDAIAALAFGIIVVKAFKERGITSRRELVKATLKAGLIAAIGLIIVYTLLGWIGTKMATAESFSNGGEVLSSTASIIFGNFGALLLGSIVLLACFSTSVGLVVASGEFFTKITKIPYKWIILITTLVSYLIANQGLNTIIGISVPVLGFLYPIVIVLVLLTFIGRLFGDATNVYRGAILSTSLISLYDVFISLGIESQQVTTIMEKLPFYTSGLGWLIPAIAGGLIGLLFSHRKQA